MQPLDTVYLKPEIYPENDAEWIFLSEVDGTAYIVNSELPMHSWGGASVNVPLNHLQLDRRVPYIYIEV